MPRRPDLEPLSAARWARVERELFDRLDREEASPQPETAPARRTALRTMTGLMLAGAAAAIVGAVSWEALRPSHAATAGVSRVATEGSASHVEFGEASLDVGPHSAVLLEGDAAGGVTVLLDHGDVECEVAPRKARPPFVVRSGEVSVRVVGTRFHVTRTGDATRVEVERGTVEVDEHDQRTFVHNGETWPAPPAPPAAATAGAAPGRGAAASPPPTRALHSGSTPLGAEAAWASPPPPSATAAAPPRPSPRERYEQALRTETSQPDTSLATYRELAQGTGPWAMNALFAEGRLESERGHNAEATRLLDEYLLRFPTGPNAEDARQLRARLE